jgi:hypothetical protein
MRAARYRPHPGAERMGPREAMQERLRDRRFDAYRLHMGDPFAGKVRRWDSDSRRCVTILPSRSKERMSCRYRMRIRLKRAVRLANERRERELQRLIERAMFDMTPGLERLCDELMGEALVHGMAWARIEQWTPEEIAAAKARQAEPLKFNVIRPVQWTNLLGQTVPTPPEFDKETPDDPQA